MLSLSMIQRKIDKSLKTVGWMGTLRRFVRYCYDRIANLLSPTRRQNRHRDLNFDRIHNVSTEGIIPLSELAVEDENWIYGLQYEPTPFDDFERLIKALKIHYEDFTFIDFGSGKGRSMFLASDYPFRRIVGVELSQELHDVCVQNISQFTSSTQRCFKLESFASDATRFELPPEPTVIYLANPFTIEVMTPFIAHLKNSLATAPRQMYVAYYYPRHADLFDAQREFQRIATGPGFAIWESTSSNLAS